ncbi:MAG: dynamin family protein [Cyanophyceae cyanobacterium]
MTLKPNVQELQQDVLELLKQIGELMERAAALSTEHSPPYVLYRQEIAQAARNVADLELRMAVVAPMKAGKSTIVNSIVGQELLPSRNTAMTMLPTEIVFNGAIAEPVLTLSPKILSVFQAALTVLRWQTKALGIEQMRTKVGQYPHLMELLEAIPAEVPLLAKACGREEIENTLTTLNDVIRLCSIVNPAQDPLAHLMELPHLETPFWHSPTQPPELGNLVIVDTPGPNEAEDSLKLMSVVEEQLRRSSLVLLVLDFTQLNTQAAAEVKQHVQPVIELLGPENLYILVNKIDQRRQGDLSPQEVREFVCADLSFDHRYSKRIFEVSAIRAFSAAKFLRERQQYPDANLADLESASALAQEALGPRWASKLARSRVAELQEEALYLWEDSGMQPFLGGAIQALLESAAPRCMVSALQLGRNLLLELKNDLNLRQNAWKQEEETWRLEVEALAAELLGVEQCRDRLQAVEPVSHHLKQSLDNIIKLLHQKLQVRVEDFLIEDSNDWHQLLQQLSPGQSVSSLDETETFSTWLKHSDLSFQYKSFGIFEFTTEQEARNFAEQAVTWIQQAANKLLENVGNAIEQQIERAQAQLQLVLTQELAALEEAQSCLPQNFKRELTFSRPALASRQLNCRQTVVEQIDKPIKNVEIKVKRPFYFLFLLKVEQKIPITKIKTYYTVSLEELAKQINQAITDSIAQLNQQIAQYVQEEWQQHVEAYFGELNHYLYCYQDSLRQAQQAKQQSLAAESQLAGTFKSLVSETAAKLKKSEIYLERTNALLNAR